MAESSENLTLRSLPAMITGVVLSILLVGGSVALWVAMGPLARSQWTWPQLLTITLLLAAIVAVLLGVGFSKVSVGPDGVVVRNALHTTRYTWAEVEDFTMNTGDPWAYLQLVGADGAEGDARMILAVQRAEGDEADEHLARLRHLVQVHKGSGL